MSMITIGVYCKDSADFQRLNEIIPQEIPSVTILEIRSLSEKLSITPEIIFLFPALPQLYECALQARRLLPDSALILLLNSKITPPEKQELKTLVDDTLFVSELSTYLISKSVEYALRMREMKKVVNMKSSSGDFASNSGNHVQTDNNESSLRVHTLMLNTSEGIVELDKNLSITNFNKNVSEVYQIFYKGSFRIGDNIFDHTPPERKERMREIYNEVLTGKIKELKLEMEKDGVSFIVKMKYLPVMSPDNEVSSIIIMAEQITNESNSLKANLQRELELLSAEEKYRDLFEKANEGIVVHDGESGKIVDINQNACNMIRATKEEVLSGRVDVFGHHITGYRFSDAIKEQNRPVVNGKQSFDWQASRKDGSLCWLEVSLFPTEIAGNDRILVFIRDINDRKMAEELTKATLRAKEKILNSSLDVICSIDSEGKFVMVSDAVFEVWGYTPKELIGKRYMDMVYPEDQEKTKHVAEKIINGTSVKDFENRFIRKDGKLVNMVWSANYDPEDKLMYGTGKDVTEKKILEQALGYEQSRYREIFNRAPAVIAMLQGPQHQFVMVNPVYRELAGKGAITGQIAKEVFPEAEAQGFISILDNVYKTGVAYEAREALFNYQSEDGSQKSVYLDFIYQPYEDSHKNIEGVIFFGVDVTEKVIARKKIKENEERYKQIVTTAQEGIWMWNEAGIVTFCNRKLCELLEYPENEIIGKSHFSFLEKGEKEFASRYFSEVNKGAQKRCELKYYSRNGKTIWVQVAGSAIFESGKLSGTMAMVSDVTTKKSAEEKLKKSEANLNSIIDNTDIAYTLLDKDLKIILYNQAAYEYTLKEQCKKLEINRHIRDYTPAQMLDNIDEIYRNVLKGSVFSSTISFASNDQGNFYSIRKFPVCSLDNKTLGVLIAMDDITERKNAEELLEKQNKQLRKTNEELDRFVYSASHDLRAPLASILGLINIANIENDVSKLRNINKMISSSVTKLDGIVRDIIDHSRNARVEIEVSLIDFKELVNESIQQLHYMEIAENIDIQVIVEGRGTFLSDKKRVGVIINNLLSNAIKYHNLRQSSPYIHIKFHVSDGKAHIAVIDNGNGIDPVSIDRIFNMFYRGTENSTGSGLGLYIVKEIIEKLSGSIRVESSFGSGTTFYIELPDL